MKKVMIKIRGTQGLGKKKDIIEFTTEGTLRKVDGDFVLSYLDGAVIQNAEVKTRVIASGNKSVTLERSGEVKSKLFIEKGVRNSCFYSVPEGSLTLGIYGKEIENSLSEDGGKIKMVYTLDADLRLISENSVEINVEGR
ncbi:MAG: DUF1934 domain-containing protein [Clostridia bacterium]|nr:DUF1934 domain-containing protein [Clostridia bacterium]